MSYTCPDCEDGILVAKVREIPIEPDETVRLASGETVEGFDGRILIASVRCNNGCSSESDDEEEETAEDVDCGRPGCKKKGPHRHYGKRKVDA